MIAAVTNFAGILSATDFNITSIIPTFSAKPAPSIVTKTNPKGANPVKFVTILFKNNCNCSFDNKFTPATVSPVPGWTAETPLFATIADIAITTNHNIKNIVTGSGNLLPTTSTPFKNLIKRLCFSTATSLFFKVDPPFYVFLY